ncbi:hypothetical protein [Nesterenkonia jeotgali]|uniref:hypothetical protein n=1 Tax=Nesterenkonia jeotgali TaxID=317018 RepID=UPI00073A1438|nr:hypothetical protein [Nesterenkonia jeotgali]
MTPVDPVNDQNVEPEYLELWIPKVDEWINLNNRWHWSKERRVAREWRSAGKLLCLDAKLPRLQRARIDIYVHKSNRTSYDAHNLMATMKPVIDGLVDAGLLPDDNNNHLTGPIPYRGDVRPAAGLTVRIFPLPAVADA